MASELANAIDAFLEAEANRSSAQRRYQITHDEVRRLMFMHTKTKVHRCGNLIIKESGSRSNTGNLRVEQVKDVPD